ncbi:unnamed protein product [Rhizopus stolonifer]
MCQPVPEQVSSQTSDGSFTLVSKSELVSNTTSDPVLAATTSSKESKIKPPLSWRRAFEQGLDILECERSTLLDKKQILDNKLQDLQDEINEMDENIDSLSNKIEMAETILDDDY